MTVRRNFLRASLTGLALPCLGIWIAASVSVVNAEPEDYDSNANGVFERDEVVSMVAAYFRDKVAKEEVLAVLIRYFIDSATYFYLDDPTGHSSDSFTFLPGSSSTTSVTSTVFEDKEALVALYQATGGANWKNNTNWLSDKPIYSWYGVLTSHDGRVIKLSLFNNGLTGEVPAEFGDLDYLGEVNLGNNRLTGEIPAGLSDLRYLDYLNLASNELTGDIPAELSKLSNLRYLVLSQNGLTGDVPPELSRLSDLEFLYLSDNGLTGDIPRELGSLSDLRYLDLGNNELTGDIPPELGNLSRLGGLDLRNNGLVGEIPPELATLSNLSSLILHGNRLTGCIPTGLQGLLSDVDWLPIC